MPGDYIKCPRCELNYIKRGEEYCAVCKAELKKGPQLIFAVDDEDDTNELELCPVCHQNPIRPGEKMCAKCAEEQDYLDNREDPDDESWKEFLDNDEDEEEEEDEEMISLNKLAEEEGGFDDDEEEEDYIEESIEPDDFDIPEVDASDFEEDDEDDEDDDEDDEDGEDDF